MESSRGLATSQRSSPRSRRDNTSLLPSIIDPRPRILRPSLFFRSPTGSFNARKPAQSRPAGGWITQLLRRYLPWLAIILVWFLVGYRLHIQWTEYSRPTESTLSAADSEPDLGDGVNDIAKLDEESEQYVDQKVINDQREIDERNSYYGTIVGPFDEVGRQFLGGRRTGNSKRDCSKLSRFGEFVRDKSFVMVFHELSMTGAPLAVLELASKIISCGGKASAVVLNRRGGLYEELVKRGIVVLRDKLTASWKAAARADLVVASSASCNTWIEQYLRHNRKGGDRLVWWMMENRREYFDRSRLLLARARALVFLSRAQEEMWRLWAREEAVRLPSLVKVVSLSVSDDLATSAGLNDDIGTVNSFLEAEKKRRMVREFVRKQMGLLPSDYLVISLSSINPGKGQLRMLQAAAAMVDRGGNNNLTQPNSDGTDVRRIQRRKRAGTRNLKILLGSVGSKSNKPEYLDKIHELLDAHPSLAAMLLWTEATVHVAPLYAAADAYIMNAQGIGETFGRVTIEAMAFGLPVLGTDAGGTKEIVQANVTGLLHPAGQIGVPVLAHNLEWLLAHPEVGVEMGNKGMARVQRMYRDAPMYEAMASVFLDAVQEPGG